MKKITLNVKGMHCPSCEMLVNDRLKEFDGIKTTQASHKEKKISIEFDETKIDIKQIKAILTNDGYKVE